MEDDDEFGDLYTDVLRPLQQQLQSKPASPARPIDLNIQSDDEEILYGAPNSNPKFNLSTTHRSQTLPSKSEEEAAADPAVAGISDPRRNLDAVSEQGGPEVEKEKGLAEGSSNWASDSSKPSGSRVLESGGDVELVRRGFEDPNLVDESKIGVLVEKRDDKDDDTLVKKGEVLVDKKEYLEKFDAEEEDVGTEIGDMGSEPVIPGLSIPGVADVVDNRGAGNFVVGNEASGEGTDWDSDSEDDLQIVLNDNDHGPMAMDGAGVMGSDDEDEDGDPLVIVADNEPGHQPMEEQDWGEDTAQAADGEKKELGDAAKVNAGVAVAPKIGYSNHAYHPYHSQFKYIRPGAAPMPGAPPVGPGGAPGQVRPPVGMGPVSGRGRGDWRPMQKSFHQFGMPGWGNNSSGRGFGSGLEFTLPSHKTIFEVDVDSFEEKPWRLPGVDVSDFFNFGLNEESWKDYCKQLEQLRLETTMQSRIRVYESGRTEQEYDPDLPPELAAAAGIHDISSENANPGKMDAEQSEVVKGAARVRPPLPTGRPIQVETSYAERLPSIDTRPPRVRDSDAIIEIILQDSADDDSFQGNDVTDQPENEPSRDDSRGGPEIGRDIAEEDTEHFNGFSQANNGRKREVVGIATQTNYAEGDYTEGVGTLPSPLKAPIKHSPNSRGQTSASSRDVGSFHEERQTKGKVRDRSSDMAQVESTVNKKFPDEQREDLIDSTCGKPSPRLASPVTAGSAGEPDVERDDSLHDEVVLADGRSVMDREETALDLATAMDTCIDENAFPSVKKQKLSSRVEHSSLQDTDGGDFKAARSSENSKARSGSSRDHQKLRDSVDEEVVQRGHSTRMGDLKRDEQSVRRKGRDERHEMEKRRLSEKGREDAYSRRDRDPHSIHQSHGKTEGVDRRKEREGSEVAWQRQDDDQHGRRSRAEDTRKREYGDEIGSRHRSKVRDSERTDKDERLHLRKQMDNGSSRSHHDKDVGSRLRERDDNLKSRYDNMDDLRGKRRKEEEHLRRDAEKEEILHGHRENTNRRKRERDDSLDLRKRDDQLRIRDDDFHSVRHKEEGWIHRERSERPRERDEWHRIKQSHEESFLKRDREEGRTGVRGGRAAEEKALISHSRVKDKGSDRDTQLKDTGRQNEQHKRRDWVEDLSQHRGREDVHAHGGQLSNDERRSRQDRAARSDRTILGSDKHKALDKKNKDVSRRVKESEGGDQNSMGQSKRNQEDRSGQMNEPVTLKGTAQRGNGGQEIPLNRQSSRHKEDASSEDELEGSKRGRSKLERWTSHKERDFSIGTKSSSTLNFKEISKYNNGGSSSASKLPDESSKTVETIRNQQASCEQKDAGDTDNKNADVKPLDDKHLETVAKLKKRSERFKLPMPIDKDAMVIKKMESEPLPSAQNEARADSEIKQERPARKRRWVNN